MTAEAGRDRNGVIAVYVSRHLMISMDFGTGSDGLPNGDDPVGREGNGQGAAGFINSFLVRMNHPGNSTVPVCAGSSHKLELKDTRDKGRTHVVAISIGFKGTAKSFIGHGFEYPFHLIF